MKKRRRKNGIKSNAYDQCGDCGVKFDGSSEALAVEWRRFAMETSMSKVGKSLKKLTLVHKKTSSEEFIEYLKLKLQTFTKHNSVFSWQDK